MDIQAELYIISEKLKQLRQTIEEQRVELDCTSDYFKEYVSEICVPTINKNLDYLENSILHLERKRSEDEEFTIF